MIIVVQCFSIYSISLANASDHKVWGAYQTPLFSGSYYTGYKIDLPLGTHSLTPPLFLSYKSYLANNESGWVGTGWEIPQSYVKTNTDGTFSLFLNGAKHDLVSVAADGRYHTKIEKYLKIEKKTGAANEKGDYWTVIDTSGTEYRFGANLDSENMLITSDPVVTPGVWRWSLDQVKDTNGNCIYYSYTEDQGAVYPSRIEYNNDRQRVIEFVLEDRPDPYQTVEQGSEISVAKRLSRINVLVGGSLVKSFKLDYAPITTQIPLSILTTITKSGSDGTPLPPTKFTYTGYTAASEQTWLLETINEDLGGITTISYTPSITYPNIQLPSNYWLVSAITSDNGLPVANPQHTTSTTGFSYAQGVYDTAYNEFRGFGQVTETRPDGAKVVHTYHQDDAKKGKEAQTLVTDAAGYPYAGIINTWSATAANGVYSVNLDRVEESSYDGKAENPKQVVTDYEYDSYGNVTLQTSFGDTSVSGDELFTTTEYVYNTDNWIVDKVKHVYSTASTGGLHLRESWFNYDGLDNLDTPPIRGNLTREEYFLDTGANPVITYEYDSYGNRTVTTDPEKRVTKVKYDDIFHTFPVEVTNAKQQTTVREFNPANGQPTLIKDPNNIVTAYKYDAVNRLIKEIKPGDSETYPTTEITYLLDGTAPEGVKVAKREKSGTDNTLDTFQFVDGFGRQIQTKTEYKNSTNRIALDVYYDAMGMDYKHSIPYLTDPATAYSTPLNVAAAIAEYDTLGRATKTTNPDTTFASTTYDHWAVTATDENGHSKISGYDANKNLLHVVERNHVGVTGGTITAIDESYTTNYKYNPLGELLQTLDHYGNIVTYQYDTLGRKIKSIDPDQGRKDFVYDLVGNLAQQTDARGKTTKYQYDPLNRTLQVIYPKDKGVQYTYDLDTIGTLSKVEDALGTVAYKYDSRLRRIQEERAMDGMTWTTKWAYDAMDRVVSQTYPDGNAVGFTYNSMGMLGSIPTILSNIDYNERGLEITRSYANGLNTEFDYNPLNQRLSKIVTAGTQDFSYGYDSVGNVQSISNASDVTNKRNEVFIYDDLNRLVNAEDPGSNGYKKTYGYNAIGNMLSETDANNGATSVAQYTYGLGGAGPHAVTGKSDTKPVIGAFSLNGGKAYSTTQSVTLNNIALGNPSDYIASEKADFSDATWQPYSSSPTFNLSIGFGSKTIYFKVRNANGETAVVNGDIQFLLDSKGNGIPDVYNPDLDNDGIPDAWELANGIVQTVPGHALLDPDHDGLTNLQEYLRGTNPNKVDSDNDGWSDPVEIANGTNPSSNGIDNVLDTSSENYSVQLGRFNQGGNLRTSGSYTVADALATTISVNVLPDSDGDGIPDIIDPDADNDGIPDAWEKAYGINLTVPGHAQLDPDLDGLTNLQEYQQGTNPNKTDTDVDGLSDFEEAYVYHSDPNAINTFQPATSENYSLVNAGFIMGGGERSGATTKVSDRIGSQLSGMTLKSNNNVSVNPAMINFGVVDANGQLSQITVNNLGSGNVIIGAIKVEGDNRLEFTIPNDACSNHTIAPGGTCTLSVSFTPEFAGAKDAILSIPTGDLQTPFFTINLSGIAGTAVIDQTPPTGTIKINNGASVINSRQVVLSLSAQDASGVAGMCISNSNVCSAWEAFAGSRTWTLPEGDGTYSVYAWYRDGLGNANFTPYTSTIAIDTQAPVVIPSKRGGIFNSSQTITLTASKPATIFYTLNGMNPTTSSTVYKAPLTLNGNTLLKSSAYDVVGNASDMITEQYIIDKTGPVLSVTSPVPGFWTNLSTVILKGKVTDGSRLSSFKVNNADVSLGYDGSFAQTLNLSPGLNQITSVAIDEVGNQSSDTRPVGLDQQAPTVAINLPVFGKTVYGTSYVIQGMAGDGAGSGIQRVEVSTDGGQNWVTTTGTANWSLSWQLPPPGNYTIKARAIDVAGNTGFASDVGVTVPTGYRLDILIDGTGSGSVISPDSGISCNSTCWGVFDNNSAITLKASPSYSIFTGWSGACNGTGDCNVTLEGNTSVTASFAKDLNHVARITGQTSNYYPSLQAAYTAASTGSTIQVWGIELKETCVFDMNTLVVLKGGYDSSYISNGGMTTINGKLVIKRGTIKVDNLVIK